MDSDRALMQQALDALNQAAEAMPFPVALQVRSALRARLAQPESDPDPSRCPKCGGEADNGHDRCDPPNPYHCTKCMAQPELVAEVDEVAQRFDGNWSAIVCTGSVKLRAGDKLYAAPPARQWVDLTDEDKQDLYSNWGVSLAAMHFVSERLKAKNGGTE